MKHYEWVKDEVEKLLTAKVTRKFTWPMPKVEDIFSKLNGASYFTTLDLHTGYHHIPLDKSSIPTTAFNSPFGKYDSYSYIYLYCTTRQHITVYQQKHKA